VCFDAREQHVDARSPFTTNGEDVSLFLGGKDSKEKLGRCRSRVVVVVQKRKTMSFAPLTWAEREVYAKAAVAWGWLEVNG
jgi:hypothetical protein